MEVVYVRKKLGWFIVVVVLGFAIFLSIKIPALGLDSTEFCVSCHVMQSQFDTHAHSAHGSLTNCGDCHIPHSLAYGAIEKAYAGAKDFVGVVVNTDPYEIHSSRHGKQLIQANCIRCHKGLLEQIGNTHDGGGKYCFDCHRNTPHGVHPNMPSNEFSKLSELGKTSAGIGVEPIKNAVSDVFMNKTSN